MVFVLRIVSCLIELRSVKLRVEAVRCLIRIASYFIELEL